MNLERVCLHTLVFSCFHTVKRLWSFVHEIDRFKSTEKNYQDSDSLYIRMYHYEKLKKAGYVGDILRQWKNDYADGGIFYGLFEAPKMKLCNAMDKYGTLRETINFKGFHDTKSLLNADKFFKLKDGETLNGEPPLPWKRSIAHEKTIDKKRKRDCC